MAILFDFYSYRRELSATDKVSILLRMDEKVLERRVKALDKRRGTNLQRLRTGRGWSQVELATKTGIGQTKISAYENGLGFDKETLIRFCEVFGVKEWEFDWEEDVPVIKDQHEQADLFRRREARAMGVAEDVVKYETFRIAEAKKNTRSGVKGASEGVARRGRKRAG